MAFSRYRQSLTNSLRPRVLLLTFAIFLAVSLPAYVAFNWMVDRTILRLGTLFAEKQVLFDRYRGLETLFREASLAETLARAPAILDWAQDENDPDKRRRGIAELEHYRLAFKDKSYFFVIHDSGSYYFNNKEDTYSGGQLRYTLSPENPRDGWYYKTITEIRNCQLNVDHDDNIRVTKVWVNCKVQENGRVLGVIGTGIDLTDFIREVVDIPQIGVDSLFVDGSGAIQAHRDPRMVDFHSLTKDTKSKKTIFALLDRQRDRDLLAQMMTEVSRGGDAVKSRFVEIEGKRYLAGVGYLDQLGWYNVSLMDVDRIIERDLFTPIAILLLVMLAFAATAITLLFKRVVLDRLARLEDSVHRVQEGDYGTGQAEGESDIGQDEIGRLSRAFGDMAKAVGDNTHLLENLVRERTEKLEKLAYLDVLTDLYNRRGFADALERARSTSTQSARPLGLLMLDLDMLKRVNDSFGHHAGDAVLVEVGRRLSNAAQPQDVCARWGGDEFILLISDCDEKRLPRIADRILNSIAGEPVLFSPGKALPVTVSIGACLVAPDESVEEIMRKADAALYAAKREGRNHVVIFTPDTPADTPDSKVAE
ncbi:MAG: diguanylate cyclase [Alphaproteobacteria bacterium]|nr:diguanylate cyclase [Alphaproteobacteria bacterium]